MIASILLTLVTASVGVVAVPSAGHSISGLSRSAIRPLSNLVACPLSSAVLSLPSNQTTISVPSGTSPINIALGYGVQNYTCTPSTGTYASTGAIATLLDISCLYGNPEFDDIQDDFFALPERARKAIVKIASGTPLLLAYHYFITNPLTGTGINPKFAKAVDGGAEYTVLAKAGGVHSPGGTVNVDWLQLNSITGDWGSTVFRVDTVAGQPPANCTGTGSISVPYAAKYWFLG